MFKYVQTAWTGVARCGKRKENHGGGPEGIAENFHTLDCVATLRDLCLALEALSGFLELWRSEGGSPHKHFKKRKSMENRDAQFVAELEVRIS